MRIYEHVPQELDEVLPFRNAIFGYVSKEHWQAMNCTAVVAREDGRLLGFIPLQYRQQRLNVRTTIPVVYENAVGVAEGMRGQGIGTQMMDEAARFISDRVDAMMVIRSGERSDGYRFYRKTGHGDIMYARHYFLPSEVAWPPADEGEHDHTGISVLDRERWVSLEPQLLALYERKYGRFGGGQQRAPGYWETILKGHVFTDAYRPGDLGRKDQRWQLVVLTSGADRLAGYLVAAEGLGDGTQGVHIYEVVGESDDAVERLIRHTRRFASDGKLVLPSVSLANPICSLLRRIGFVEMESTSHIMARILRPDRIFRRLAAGSDLLDTLSLTLMTPHRTLVVNEPPEPRYTVQVQAKESVLSRLFCCRLDLRAAVEMELVRWNAYDPGLQCELEQVFAFSEWVQWFTDFI